MVLLPDQDRTQWDRALIAEGQAIVRRCLRRNAPGPYQIQAAINAVHSDARDRGRDRLAPDRRSSTTSCSRSRRTRSSRSTARSRSAEVEGPSRRSPLVDALDLDSYHLFHATRAELLARLERYDEARAAYDRAVALDEQRRRTRAARSQAASTPALTGQRSRERGGRGRPAAAEEAVTVPARHGPRIVTTSLGGIEAGVVSVVMTGRETVVTGRVSVVVVGEGAAVVVVDAISVTAVLILVISVVGGAGAGSETGTAGTASAATGAAGALVVASVVTGATGSTGFRRAGCTAFRRVRDATRCAGEETCVGAGTVGTAG